MIVVTRVSALSKLPRRGRSVVFDGVGTPARHLRRLSHGTLEDLTDRVNENAALGHRGRWVNLTFLLGIGEVGCPVTIREGRVANITPRRQAADAERFAIRAMDIARLH